MCVWLWLVAFIQKVSRWKDRQGDLRVFSLSHSKQEHHFHIKVRSDQIRVSNDSSRTGAPALNGCITSPVSKLIEGRELLYAYHCKTEKKERKKDTVLTCTLFHELEGLCTFLGSCLVPHKLWPLKRNETWIHNSFKSPSCYFCT